MKIIPPGKTIGILGGGQLGRMLAFDARRTGYKIATLDPTEKCPTGLLADIEIVAKYDDLGAALRLAENSDVITYEFENINVDIVKELEKDNLVYPGSHVLEVTQHRVLEKTFFKDNGIPVTEFAKVVSEEDLQAAEKEIGYPAVLKTCRFGYDGKGQAVIENREEAMEAYEKFENQDLIWEKMVPFEKEISVVCARSTKGEVVTYPIPENIHKDNILDISIVPARISDETEEEAKKVAMTIAEKLDVVGTFCIELFVLPDGGVMANEIAPRPHNSGHYTIEGCLVSQFENQMRAICGLPLGSTELLSPTVMMNILGDDKGNDLLGVEELFADPDVRLHLYQKHESKPKRKMGHITVLGKTVDEALEKAKKAREKLSWGSL